MIRCENMAIHNMLRGNNARSGERFSAGEGVCEGRSRKENSSGGSGAGGGGREKGGRSSSGMGARMDRRMGEGVTGWKTGFGRVDRPEN